MTYSTDPTAPETE